MKGDNLYIGTSASEILHYVLIPPDPNDDKSEASFILASRLHPTGTEESVATGSGVSQVLILPDAGKACILCDGIGSFYSLPELTPAYGVTVKDSVWIGGVDLSGERNEEQDDSTVVMICQKSRIRLVRLGQRPKPQGVQQIELGGAVAAVRRGDIACTADGRSYSLVDVVEQEAIPLFEIASTGPPQPDASDDDSEDETPPPPPPKDVAPAALTSDQAETRDAGRDTAQDGPDAVDQEPRPEDNTKYPTRNSSIAASSQPIVDVNAQSEATLKPPSNERRTKRQRSPKPSIDLTHRRIRPNIVSPTASEFLLTTGTSYKEAGVGMFVNLDGDVSRPTIEFLRYPHTLVLDGQAAEDSNTAAPGTGEDASLVLALVDIGDHVEQDLVIEVQNIDSDDRNAHRALLRLPGADGKEKKHFKNVGLRSALATRQFALSEVIDLLRVSPMSLKRRPRADEASAAEDDDSRIKNETAFVARFAKTVSHLHIWAGNSIWNAIRSPLVLQYESQLSKATGSASGEGSIFKDMGAVRAAFYSLRGRETSTELDFFTLSYLRQKSSLLLFLDLVARTVDGLPVAESEVAFVEETMLAGDLDPRLLLQLLPHLQDDIFAKGTSIWVFNGLAPVVRAFEGAYTTDDSKDVSVRFKLHIYPLIKRYLYFWRQKKGFGSVSDEVHVFKTVDLALLHVLLILDEDSPRVHATEGSIRRELNIVVDRGVDCFDEAIVLLEHFQRLYILSRLYQSRKQTAQVLATWQRILEGEPDAGGEFDGDERAMRDHLMRIRDRSLVERYGSWLAERNPELGVSVFINSDSKVKFTPEQTLAILQERAPGTVRRVLEHLVFDRRLAQYANNLITYYLDGVLDALSTSEESREAVHSTYSAYRALTPPKPTYSQFITENAPQEGWWRYRSRLLQLLGGSHGAASQYDVPAMLERIEPYKNELVPEMIILGGRQARHEDAIKLLTHGLGDYDTAIRYCVRGGSGTYSTLSPGSDTNARPSYDEQVLLFSTLFKEFLAIEDVEERKQQVGNLLERYSAWFDVEKVLDQVPNDWGVDVLAGFLEGSFRVLVSEGHDAAVIKGLLSTLNLDVSAQVAEKIAVEGPHVVLGKDSGVDF